MARHFTALFCLTATQQQPRCRLNSRTVLFAGVLRLLGEAGVPVPPLSQLAVMDPRLLCWLLEPHLLQVRGMCSAEGAKQRAEQPELSRMSSSRNSCTSDPRLLL